MDVQQVLKMRNCICFEQSFNRPNLFYEIRPKAKNIEDSIVTFVNSNYPADCGIIYCISKKNCETLTAKLKERGMKVEFYHAGLHKDDRAKIQKDWGMNKVKIIIATIAFGMGIDKPDVRFVIHHSIPQSLEGYYQETGRAGRDGKPSRCVLFYSYKDKSTVLYI